LRGLYVFSHDTAVGKAPAETLFDRIRVRRNGNLNRYVFGNRRAARLPDVIGEFFLDLRKKLLVFRRPYRLRRRWGDA